ncbi:hypothetical protein IV73_GL001059 [Weissella kandleri]|uniref:DNA-directed RNA polymerase beta subunit n=1 Tax=Weissella kandleri TaxID=1616 RepID=A0A0R2JBW6_9LACO|nr:hypothetical protein [Weissella kandleri]KRN74783.1 hypothetical protein IV73_GL001059 [Weissella kandleri]
MVKMEESQRERAKTFFEKEYKERGMVKWQGYYLSDHTENVSEYTNQRREKMHQRLMPKMTLEAISSVLFTAYVNYKAVNIQENAILNGLAPAIVSGMVKGYDENNVYIGDAKFDMTDINWVQLK